MDDSRSSDFERDSEVTKTLTKTFYRTIKDLSEEVHSVNGRRFYPYLPESKLSQIILSPTDFKYFETLPPSNIMNNQKTIIPSGRGVNKEIVRERING